MTAKSAELKSQIPLKIVFFDRSKCRKSKNRSVRSTWSLWQRGIASHCSDWLPWYSFLTCIWGAFVELNWGAVAAHLLNLKLQAAILNLIWILEVQRVTWLSTEKSNHPHQDQWSCAVIPAAGGKEGVNEEQACSRTVLVHTLLCTLSRLTP